MSSSQFEADRLMRYWSLNNIQLSLVHVYLWFTCDLHLSPGRSQEHIVLWLSGIKQKQLLQSQLSNHYFITYVPMHSYVSKPRLLL